MQKCPNCGFEPVEGCTTCPKCGFSLQLNEEDKIKKDDDLNDTIEWSKLANMPIESVQQMFKENEDKMKEADSEREDPKHEPEEALEMNPILAQYIRQHKEGADPEDDSLLSEAIEEAKAEEEHSSVEESDQSEKSNELSEEPNEPEVPDLIIESDNVTSTEESLKEEQSEVVNESKVDSEESEELIEEPDFSSEQTEPNPLIVDPEFESEVSVPLEEDEATNESEKVVVEPIVESRSEETDTEPNAINEPEEAIIEPVISNKSEEVSADEPVVETTADQEAPPSNTQPPEEKPKKNRKRLFITLAAVIVLGLGGGYYYQHEKKVEAQRIATIKKDNESLDTIEKSINDYYTTDKKIYLAADKLDLNAAKIDEELAGYKSNDRYDDLKKEYDELVAKQKAEQAVNQLFTSAAIDGDKMVEKPLLKTADPVDLTVDTGDKEFDGLMAQAITNAKDQYTKVEAAKKGTASLLKDGKMIDSVTRDQYNTANNAVKAVANQQLVKTQIEELARVDQTLKDKEKKAAEEKAAAEKAAKEKSEQDKAAQKAANTSAAGDTSSSAYTWAAGVKEQVIQTCISRGYIVEGGYSLVPVKIENGEGYYNLYATSNRAALTKGYSDSDLPMYLVTINCKTGWFKGNGPN
ncbi:cell division site-positioning protein MapZ family protein [Enterococcus sp. 22-H-5-01]|uniref:cell division site-positioning protein MapZ family protein n=1 Tax=Enterococcus sp. 22-H-5-01 TaxID=3418555 RepID=UPI003D012CFF